MTPDEWAAWTRTTPMLSYLLGLTPEDARVQDVEIFPACRVSERKLRLFACACYHRARHLLPDPRAGAAVEIAEQVADSLLPVGDLERSETPVREACHALEGRWRAARGRERIALAPTHHALGFALVILWPQAQKAAYYAASNARLALAEIANPGAAPWDKGFGSTAGAEEKVQTDLLRCIFGPLPLRQPNSIDPSWLSPDVLALARRAYDERKLPERTLEPARLAALADAIEAAGCTDTKVLAHLRSPGPHVRGCFTVDAILTRR